MTPFDPMAPEYYAWRQWRKYIQFAKEDSFSPDVWAYMAAWWHGQYEMFTAITLYKHYRQEKSNG